FPAPRAAPRSLPRASPAESLLPCDLLEAEVARRANITAGVMPGGFETFPVHGERLPQAPASNAPGPVDPDLGHELAGDQGRGGDRARALVRLPAVRDCSL